MPRRPAGPASVPARIVLDRTLFASHEAVGFSNQQHHSKPRIRAASHWSMTMAEDFPKRLPYGLSDLPPPPPDDFNPLYPANDLASIGMQRAGEAQVVPAQFRGLQRGIWPTHPVQGGLAPGGGQLPEIPMPEWWKKWGPVLQEILPRITPGFGGGGEKEDAGCKEEWDQARADCAQELAKPYPNRGKTGGYTNVEDCARGFVGERCGGNPVDYGRGTPRRNSR
jgi:hypothetical protein